MSSIDIMNKFMENIKNACGDEKCIDENFKFLNDEIKKGNARIGKKDVKDIITTFYKETSKFPELNKFWSNYTNILQYNNKEVRRILVCNLVQRDVENGIPCPYRVLEIVFQDRELVKLINSPQTYIQAALQVKDLSPNHLNLLGGDSVGGRIFRKELENLFMHKWKTLLCSKNAEGNLKAIEDVFEYIKIIRKNLNKVANEDIIANFNNFGKVCCNLNIYTCASSTTKELSNHNKVMEKPSFLNYEKLLKDYSRGMVRKEILYELLYEIYIYENKREELLSYLKSRYNNIYYIFKDLKYKSVCETGFIPDQITRICMSRGYPSTIIKPQFQTEYYSLEKSKLFIECDPNTCVKNCDKKSHTKWFKINFVEGSELSLNVVEELKDLAKNGQNQTLFLDVKSLCYLATSYDYDESESFPYSYWQRKSLREDQRKEMATRLLALYDIYSALGSAMRKNPEYQKYADPITQVRV
uniref:NARG2_C domain-containing protein n=1 Tax=Strongyloides papillosus TaxID=174720 RepID=A0A0N5B3W4_STREA